MHRPRPHATRVAIALLVGLLPLLAAGCDDEGPRDPDQTGPHRIDRVDDVLERDGRTTYVWAHLPDTAGPAPLLVFLPGLALETLQYVPLVDRLVSHGFAVVRVDAPVSLTGMDQPALVADIRGALDWALDPAGALAGRVLHNRLGLVGHSLGGKLSLMTALADSRVQAVFALDPVVSCGGPSGECTPESPALLPGPVATLGIPLGLVGETTNATGGVAGQPCAPESGNFLRVYEAATDATALAPWVAAWEVPGADHIDFVWETEDCVACILCEEGTADPLAVQQASATLAVAFFRRHLSQEIAMDDWLLGDRQPAGLLTQHQP